MDGRAAEKTLRSMQPQSAGQIVVSSKQPFRVQEPLVADGWMAHQSVGLGHSLVSEQVIPKPVAGSLLGAPPSAMGSGMAGGVMQYSPVLI